MLKILRTLFGAPAVPQTPAGNDATEDIQGHHTGHRVVEQAEPSVVHGASEARLEEVVEVQPGPGAEPAPEPVPQIPVPKSQADIDAELHASPSWIDAVAKGEQSWSENMDTLLGAIKLAQDEGRAVPLMMLSQYFWLKTPMAELGTQKLLTELRDRIEKDFAVKSYRTYIEDKTKTRWNSYPRSVDFYVGEFLQVRPSYLVGLRDLFERIPERIAVVEGHYDTLNAGVKEFRPAAGGDNLLRFKGFLTKYAQEHLPGVTPLDFFPGDSPRYIRDYFQSDIKTSGYLLLWAMMDVVQVSRSGAAPSSTSQIGIEFERKLIAEISERFPAARIEPTPATGDQGADVILVVDGVKIVIQAKKYTGVVGNAAVQEVFAAMQFYDGDYAMVVTNSRYTPAAQTLATKIGVELATADDYLRKIQQLLV